MGEHTSTTDIDYCAEPDLAFVDASGYVDAVMRLQSAWKLTPSERQAMVTLSAMALAVTDRALHAAGLEPDLEHLDVALLMADDDDVADFLISHVAMLNSRWHQLVQFYALMPYTTRCMWTTPARAVLSEVREIRDQQRRALLERDDERAAS